MVPAAVGGSSDRSPRLAVNKSSDSPIDRGDIVSKDFLQLLETRVSGRGDLPVFRASVLEVVRLSEDTQCAASDIARVILQDQGFSVKVLRIANSPYYNRSDHSIKTISRAVVLLGVEVVRDICLGLGFVEVFQRHHPWIDLRRILARGYFTAVLTRELAGLLRDSPSVWGGA